MASVASQTLSCVFGSVAEMAAGLWVGPSAVCSNGCVLLCGCACSLQCVWTYWWLILSLKCSISVTLSWQVAEAEVFSDIIFCFISRNNVWLWHSVNVAWGCCVGLGSVISHVSPAILWPIVIVVYDTDALCHWCWYFIDILSDMKAMQCVAEMSIH